MDPKVIIADKLAAGVRDFLEACTSVWTQDVLLKTALEWSQTEESSTIGSFLVQNFSKSDEDLALAKDAAVWNHKLLETVDASGKQAQATPDIQTTVWDYLKAIADPLTMYRVQASVPTNLMDVIQDITQDFQSQMAEGSFDPKTFNPMSLGQKVFDKLGADQIQNISKQLMGTLGNDPSQLLRMMGSMQSLLPTNAPGLSEMNSMVQSLGALGGGAGGFGGMPNLDPSMMDMISKMMKKD